MALLETFCINGVCSDVGYTAGENIDITDDVISVRDNPHFGDGAKVTTPQHLNDSSELIANTEFVQEAINNRFEIVTQESSISVPTSTNTDFSSVLGTHGTDRTWRIGTMYISFPNNSTGRRYASVFRKASGGSTLGLNANFNITATQSGATEITIPYIGSYPDNTYTTMVRLWQNSGSTLTVTVRVREIIIHTEPQSY